MDDIFDEKEPLVKKVLFASLLFACPAFAMETSTLIDPIAIDRPCEVLLDIGHALGPDGRLRVVDLTHASTLNPSKAKYFANIKELAKMEFPELEISNQDRILTLDIRGDKQGYLRRLAVASLSREASDIVGLHVVTLSYRSSDFTEKPTPRVLIVMKAGVKDYRVTESSLESQDAVASWVSVQLEEMMYRLSKPRAFAMVPGDSFFQKAYELLATAPKRNSKLTPDEFVKAFPTALAKLQSTLTALDLLYFRSSFWDESPAPDDFAKQAYALMTQGSSELFEAEFKSRVLFLRNKLRDLIHERPLRSYFNFASPPLESEPDIAIHSSAPTGNADIVFSGISSQEIFGMDFQSGSNHQFQDLKGLTDPFGSDISHVVEALEQHGYTQMTQLQGISADELMRRCHFNLAEFKSLAETLSAYGVFFRYSKALYYKFESQERVMLSAPRNRVFVWDPSRNRYFRRKMKTN
jgi:hypothetical protein